MKKHSKVLATLASLLLLANVPLLSACGNDKNKEEDNTPDNGSTVTPTPTPVETAAYNAQMSKDEAQALLTAALDAVGGYEKKSDSPTDAAQDKITLEAYKELGPTANDTVDGKDNYDTSKTVKTKAFYTSNKNIGKIGATISAEQAKLILKQVAANMQNREFDAVKWNDGTVDTYMNQEGTKLYIDNNDQEWINGKAETSEEAFKSGTYYRYNKKNITQSVVTEKALAELKKYDNTASRVKRAPYYVKDAKIDGDNVTINFDQDLKIGYEDLTLKDYMGTYSFNVDGGKIISETVTVKYDTNLGQTISGKKTTTNYTYLYNYDMKEDLFALPNRGGKNKLAYDWKVQTDYTNDSAYMKALAGSNIAMSVTDFNKLLKGNSTVENSGKTFSITDDTTWVADVDEDDIAAAFIAAVEAVMTAEDTNAITSYTITNDNTTTVRNAKGYVKTTRDNNGRITKKEWVNNIGSDYTDNVSWSKFTETTTYTDTGDALDKTGTVARTYSDDDSIDNDSTLEDFAFSETSWKLTLSADKKTVILNADGSNLINIDSKGRVTRYGEMTIDYTEVKDTAIARTADELWNEGASAEISGKQIFISIKDAKALASTAYTTLKTNYLTDYTGETAKEGKAYGAAVDILQAAQSKPTHKFMTNYEEGNDYDTEGDTYTVVSSDGNTVYTYTATDSEGNFEEVWYVKSSSKWTKYKSTDGETYTKTAEAGTTNQEAAEAAIAAVASFYTETLKDYNATSFDVVDSVTLNEEEGYILITLKDVKDGDDLIYTAPTTVEIANKVVASENGKAIKFYNVDTYDKDNDDDKYIDTIDALTRLNAISGKKLTAATE